MREEMITIFQYSKPRGPTDINKKPNGETSISEKGGRAIMKVNNNLSKPQITTIASQTPELVEIKEPRTFNIQIQPQKDEE
jgi:hypothetical protein